MQRYTINFNVNTNQMINIIPIFDVHALNKTFDKNLYLKTIEYISTHQNTYWFGGGDYGEYITFKDKRFSPSELYPDIKVGDLANITQKEVDLFIDMTKSILSPDKCLGLGIGNHDNKLSKEGNGDIVGQLCNQFNLRYLGYSGFLRLSFRRGKGNTIRKFDIYYHHGFSSPRTFGSRMNTIRNMTLEHDCNIAITGHSHGRISTGPLDFQTYNGPQLKYGIICGSFKRGIDWDITTWEETRGYDQGKHQMGTYSIQIKPYPTGDAPMQYRVIEFSPEWL